MRRQNLFYSRNTTTYHCCSSPSTSVLFQAGVVPPPSKRFELNIFRWAVLPPSQPTQKIDPRPYSRSKKPVFEWVVSCLSRKWTESRILSLDISKMTLRRYLLWALMNWNGSSSSSPICSSSVIFKNPVIVHLMLFTSRMLKLIKSSWTGGR